MIEHLDGEQESYSWVDVKRAQDAPDDTRRLFVGGPWHGEMHPVGDGHPIVVEDLGPSDWTMIDAPLRARPQRTVYRPFRVSLKVAGVKRLREVWAGRQPSEPSVQDALWLWWWSVAPPVPPGVEPRA